MSSDTWVVAHLFAVFALILMPLGLLGLCRLVARSRGFGLTVAATAIIWFGAGLSLPYYGAEDFALHAIARQVRFGSSLDLLGLVEAIRFGAAATTRGWPGLAQSGWRNDRHLDLAYGDSAAQRCAARNCAGAAHPPVLSARMGAHRSWDASRARVDLACSTAVGSCAVTAADLANVSSTTTLTPAESQSMTISVQEAQ